MATRIGDLLVLVGKVGLHQSIAQPDDTFGEAGDFIFVSDDNDRLALRIQSGEQFQDFLGGAAL